VMGALGLIAVGASVYLVYTLEILKLRRVRARQMRQLDPSTSEHAIITAVERELETGELGAVEESGGSGGGLEPA